MTIEMKAVPQTGLTSNDAFRLWNFDGTQDGFAGAEGAITSNDTFITYKQLENSQLVSPPDTAIPAEDVRTFELRLRSSSDTKLTLSWNISGSQKKSDGSVSINITGDGKWHDYQIDLAGEDNWKGVVKYFTFTLDSGASADFDYIRLTGLYIVPFPWMSGNLEKDTEMLLNIKEIYQSDYGTVTVGYSAIIQYLEETNRKGELSLYGMRSVDYLVELSKATGMPVMIWLRADPWADVTGGVAKELFNDDNSLMWTQRIDDKRVYKRNETGYRYQTLAQKDIYGKETPYWTYTEKLLGQASELVAKAIEENPGMILGVTTTSEYKFNTDQENVVLDYNPATILEFRDYCKDKFGTVEELNKQCGTDFTTWDLKSTDMDPYTTENLGGFDAPRILYEPAAFWDIWTEFRGVQISRAEQRLVDIIGRYLDSKYIYTHQIAKGDYLLASPIECGDAEGSNIGIDFFNNECTEDNLKAITGMLGGDVTRTWGIPEWLALNATEYDETAEVFDRLVRYGIKYICPFNWGSGDAYDFRGSQSENAVADSVKAQSENVNLLASQDVVKFTEDTETGKIYDISFSGKSSVHTLTLIAEEGKVLPDTVSVSYLKGNKWISVGTVTVDEALKSDNVVVVFSDIEAKRVKISFDWTDAQQIYGVEMMMR